ncbi:hypothetical protein IFR05_002596 [Cadophora sp. M221]|nr:hypothetical protein IFR05_002596 [Cadophora sp. M221]
MDPLSIAASVAGLCTLAESIVHRTRAYVRSVRGSEREIAKLVRATAQLYGILEQIRLLEDGFDDDDGEKERSMGAGVGGVRGVHLVKGEELYECEKTLRKLDAVLKKSDPGTAVGFVNVTMKKLEWPFNAKEVAELLQDIENHKSMLNLALNANEMAAILSCLETSTNISHIVSQEQLVNEEFRASHRKSVFSRRRQKILDFMTMVDPRIDQTMYIQMKQDMTGLWFTEGDEFKAWLSTKNATLWLSGIPGAGKTILFSSIVDKLQKALNEKFERNDLCFDKLEEFYEVHSADDKVSLPTQSDLVALLLDMSEDVEDALILIDALDECLAERVNVAKLLHELNIRSEKIKVLFASRDEVDISAQLQGYTIVSMAENSSDIARYVESELKVKDWAKDLNHAEKETIKDSLIEPAGGMFRLVACQLDALAKCKTAASRRKVLKTLPRDLSETYYRILKQIDSTEIADNRLIVQRVLRWATWGKSSLSLKELQEAIAINPGDNELDPDVITAENDILDLCSSLVRCNSGGVIELAHATVKEFLTTIPSTSEYYFYRVDETSDVTDLAITCLTYLCLENFGVGGKEDWDSSSVSSRTVTDSSKSSVVDDHHTPEHSGQVLQRHFLDHAAANWDHYAENFSEKRPSILALEKVLFAPAKVPQFLNWAKQRLEPTPHIRRRDLALLAECTPLQWAALLGLFDTTTWLIDQGSDVNRSTVVLGNPLTCAVLGENILHERNNHLSDSGSDDESDEHNDRSDVRKSVAWHPENRCKTIAALLDGGATMDDMPSEDPRSLMERALIIGEPSHIKLLLLHGGVLDTDCLAYLEEQCSEGGGQSEIQEILETVSKVNYAPVDAPRVAKLLLQFEKSSAQAAKLLADTLETPTTGESTESQDINVALKRVSEYGQYELVAKLLEHPDIITDHGDRIGFTALHEAAQSGHLQVVQLLVEKGFSVNALDNDGDTPSMRAATYNHLEVVQFLQNHGAVLADQVNDHGETIACMAAKNDCYRTVRYIAETEPLLVSCATTLPDGMTALMVAADRGSVKCLQYILEKFPAEEITAKANDGRSVLHFAAASGNKRTVDLLLKKHADVNIKSSDGSTALHYAMSDSVNPIVVNSLIMADADWTIGNDEGDLPAHLAVAQGDWDRFSVLKKIVEAAGDDCSWVNDKSSNCRSLLQIVTSHSSFTDYSIKMLDLLCEIPCLAFEPPLEGAVGGTPLLNLVHELSLRVVYRSAPMLPTDAWRLSEAIQLLVRKGATLTCTDPKGNTALHLLCFGNLKLYGTHLLNLCIQIGNHSIVMKMLERGADVDMPDESPSPNAGLIPARTISMYRTSKEIADEILDKCSNLNSPDAEGVTLLVFACRFGKIDIARSLIAKGAELPTIAQGVRAMADATYNGHTQVVEFLIELGVDIDSTYGERRMTPLMHAIERGNLATVNLLLDKGADVSVKAAKQWTLAHHLAAREDLNLLHALLPHNLIWDDPAIVLALRGEPVTGVTPLHIAAEKGFTSMVTFLLDNKLIQGVSPANGMLTTPLHVATRVGNFHTLKTLLEAGAEVNAQDLDGYTPVHIAAGNLGQPRFQQMILEHLLGTGKYAHNTITAEGQTALHIAARMGTEKMVKLLLGTPENVNAKDHKWLTPLHYAIVRGNSEIIDILVAAGAKHNPSSVDGDSSSGKELVEPPPVFGANSLLLAAIKQRDIGLCKRAVKEGADLSFKFSECKEGKCTPLLFAIDGHNSSSGFFRPDPAIAEFLADQQIDINAKSCLDDILPIHLAAARGQDSVVKKLLARGAKTRDRTLEALHFATMEGHNSTVKILLEHEESVGGGSSKQRLLDSQVFSVDGMAFKQSPNFGRTRALRHFYSGSAMHIAADMGHDDVLETLIKEGAEIDSLNELNQTPLMHAIRADQQDSMQILLDAGANIYYCDDLGRTPAWFALGNRNSVALTSLQAKGADLSEGEHPNSWFTETYLTQALYLEAWDNVEFLLKLGHDPNRRCGPFPRTSLQVALQNEDVVKTEAFVAEHAPEYDDNEERHGTLLVTACSQSSTALVRKLIEKARGNGRDIKEYVNAGCYIYGTPLYSAAYRGNMELLMLLIEEGADVSSTEGGWLGSPLDAACAMERMDIVRVLWERGACLKKSRMDGSWMAEGCAGKGNVEIFRSILKGRDPFVPGTRVDDAGKKEVAIGGKLASRSTF